MSQGNRLEELKRGWPRLLAGLLATIAFTLPSYTAGLFIKPLSAEFGWSVTEISFGVTVQTIGALTGSVVAGLLLGRLTTRWLIIFGIAALSASAYLLSDLGSDVRVLWVVMGVGAFLGAAASPVTVAAMVIEHFRAFRGGGLGLTMVGAGLSAVLAPTVVLPIIDVHGWRTGFTAIAGLNLAFLLIVIVMLHARSGHAVPAAPPPTTEPPAWPDFALSFVSLAMALAVGGAVVHLVPMLRDAGLDTASVITMTTLMGIMLILCRICAGLALDRVEAHHLGAMVTLTAAVGFLVIAVGGKGFLWLAPLTVGVALGVELDLISFLSSEGRTPMAFGKAFSPLFVLFQLGLALSPLVYAVLRQTTETYSTALVLSAMLLGASGVMLHVRQRRYAPTKGARS